jgi:hypothetical protein
MRWTSNLLLAFSVGSLYRNSRIGLDGLDFARKYVQFSSAKKKKEDLESLTAMKYAAS